MSTLTMVTDTTADLAQLSVSEVKVKINRIPFNLEVVVPRMSLTPIRASNPTSWVGMEDLKDQLEDQLVNIVTHTQEYNFQRVMEIPSDGEFNINVEVLPSQKKINAAIASFLQSKGISVHAKTVDVDQHIEFDEQGVFLGGNGNSVCLTEASVTAVLRAYPVAPQADKGQYISYLVKVGHLSSDINQEAAMVSFYCGVQVGDHYWFKAQVHPMGKERGFPLLMGGATEQDRLDLLAAIISTDSPLLSRIRLIADVSDRNKVLDVVVQHRGNRWYSVDPALIMGKDDTHWGIEVTFPQPFAKKKVKGKRVPVGKEAAPVPPVKSKPIPVPSFSAEKKKIVPEPAQKVTALAALTKIRRRNPQEDLDWVESAPPAPKRRGRKPKQAL